MTWKIRSANKEDLPKLEAFLTEAGVSPQGLAESVENFSLMENQVGQLKACLGVEPVDKAGLLRSFVVSPQIAQPDLMLLFKRAFLTAKSQELEELYLVTNKMSAISFFGSLGFEMLNQSEIPESLLEKNHLKQVLTVDNSAIMKIIL
ncbi:GNAT family N-acetyltransferase [Mesobacillus thioparans]|uniref:GNAT family N-acetyltransferase n=1 Tax=Mesobacillus thioparans TaxID=370439 RepID=UPI0039EFFBA2